MKTKISPALVGAFVLGAFAIPAEDAPRNYALRGHEEEALHHQLSRRFRKVRKGRPGDVMMLRAGADQLHLGIKTRQGFVHAHAGIRRVVETPGDPEWPILGFYRIRRRG